MAASHLAPGPWGPRKEEPSRTMSKDRSILHADMDAFYAAIEQRDRPELQGKPVIIGGLGPRGVVSTASYEARNFGVHSALPMAQARRLCPDGIYLHPRMKVYCDVSEEIQEIFRSFTPLVEPLSLDEAFLDVTGSRLLFGDAREIAKMLKKAVEDKTKLCVSVGVASCKFLAKVASDLDKPDGLVVVEHGKEREFLARLSVTRLWGAGKVAQQRFVRSGIKTIGDVQKLSQGRLRALFGDALGKHFHEIANGIDERPVECGRDAKSLSHEMTFDKDIADRDHCLAILLEQSEKVGARLRKQGFKGNTVRLKIRFPPFETRTRQVKLGEATDQDLVIYENARELFDAVRPRSKPVRLIGVGVSELIRCESAQGNLFSPQDKKQKRVLEAMDDIRARFGKGSIGHGRT